MRRLYALIIVLVLCLFSCRTETIQCDATGVSVYFVGLGNEVNNLKLFVYKKDNLFDSLTDSVTVYANPMDTSDTARMSYTLNDNNDYKVKLVSSNTVYTITEITAGNHYSEKIQTGLVDDLVKYGCVNNIVSYTLNGQQFGKPNVMSGIYNVVYINK